MFDVQRILVRYELHICQKWSFAAQADCIIEYAQAVTRKLTASRFSFLRLRSLYQNLRNQGGNFEIRQQTGSTSPLIEADLSYHPKGTPFSCTSGYFRGGSLGGAKSG